MTTTPLAAPARSRESDQSSPAVAPSHGGNDGDHDLFSHYVAKGEWDAAYFAGRPATALCGKKWVPTKDPQKYPICPECKDKYEAMPEGPSDG
jgi:hypothetical protein